jgi:glycosyltransferase involved in cell wall biosynthesis
MKLSILIPTLPEREHLYNQMSEYLTSICPFEYINDLHIISDKRDRKVPTGQKRNDLVSQARGDYFVFVDDDDQLHTDYLRDIFAAIESKPDVITFNGFMTTDGAQRVDFEIRLDHPYKAEIRNFKEIYLRYPNHLCPMKRELVKDVKFEHVWQGEDYRWATKIRELGLLKTEVVIEKDLYHYQYISTK